MGAGGASSKTTGRSGKTARLQDIADGIRTKSSDELLSAVQKLKPTAGAAKYDAFGNVVVSQTAEVSAGNLRIQLGFSNDYDPRQVRGTVRAPIKTNIEAVVWKNGHVTAVRTLAETKTKSIKNAGKNYQGMLATWRKLIGE